MNASFPALFSKHAGWIPSADRSAARVGRGAGARFVDDGGGGKPESVRSSAVVSMTRTFCGSSVGSTEVSGQCKERERKRTDFHFFKALDVCLDTMSHQNKVVRRGLHVGAEGTAVGR